MDLMCKALMFPFIIPSTLIIQLSHKHTTSVVENVIIDRKSCMYHSDSEQGMQVSSHCVKYARVQERGDRILSIPCHGA